MRCECYCIAANTFSSSIPVYLQISPTLVPPQAGTKAEMGLPFAVSLPAELALIPGESVDLLFGKK